MRVVVVVVVVGDYFEVMILKVDLQGQGQINFCCCPLYFISHLDFPSGWDPLLPDQISLWGGIRCFQTKFRFGVGSMASRPNFSLGWDPGVFV